MTQFALTLTFKFILTLANPNRIVVKFTFSQILRAREA